MGAFKQVRSPKLEIVLQVTEATQPGMDGRRWEVHDVERNRGFRVSLTGRSSKEVPEGKTPLGRAPTEDEIADAIGLAIERALVTPPEKVSGTLYDVDVTSHDLYEAASLRG